MLKGDKMIVLGIESSCDETSVAVVKDGREILSNIIDSQIKIHEQYGGVVPEIASRNHIEAISRVAKKALEEAKITFEDIDVIAPAYGPGLVGALLVGVSYARGLAYTLKKPLVGVNHLEGHIAANYITHKDLKPPFICMLTSGGNTQIIHVKDYCDMKVLGKTRDDAIGEAFDKVARVIGLGYPGGPKVDKLAQQGQVTIDFPKTHFENLDFSFSGIKTAVINLNHKNPEINKSDLCISFEKAVTEVLIENITKAIEQTGVKTIVLAGGVSANTYIRGEFEKLENKSIKIYKPDLKLCTDNGAMIGAAGYYRYLNGNISTSVLNAVPNLKIDEI
ncbi:MAG: tRNA (adenosine(37)-N6)-threonylcarbamoyltransferase complex transferase subunit TsaD [Clostridia bacterium]|jgi:N6-L-threonylcarbamoyladenine synthase|nr:tRNA (adenosine(37)-N6)-threonylcarbamoyltransferase complex transferase subunit TsaD [Clostridia bacterium]